MTVLLSPQNKSGLYGGINGEKGEYKVNKR
jgi:hypothetical protein